MIFRNLSLHRRLMGACFLLTLLPVCLLGGLGWLLLTSIDLFGGTLPGKMVRLWPKGPVLSVQYAVSRLRDEASHEKFDWHEVKEQCDLLEANGIQAYIEENGTPFYLTSGADAAQIQKAAGEKMGSQRQAIVWDDDGFACVYISSRRQAAIYAAGDMPYQQPPYTAEQKAWRREVKAMLWLLFGGGMLLSLLLGVYLARSLSRQVLEPLSAMRRSAAAITRGDYTVAADETRQEDEVGETCRVFDAMRLRLQSVKAERQRYERRRKEMLAGISHDLATPLTSIQGYASGILEGVARTSEKKRHYLSQIVSASKVMEHLVANLLLFSKLDLGRMEFSFVSVRLAAYFRDFLAERGGDYEEKGLLLRFTCDKIAAERTVRLDPFEFQRVVENILGNSCKYNDGHSSLDIILQSDAQEACIIFADHGVGVPPTTLPRLFDIFYRTDQARSNTARGSGLGLAIARGIVQNFGGRIWAEGTSGGGLTIKIAFPWEERPAGGIRNEEHPDC